MASNAPPAIFAPRRRLAARRRMRMLQTSADAPRYLMADMVEDVEDRLGFLRIEPKAALVIGDWTGMLAEALSRRGAEATSVDPAAGFDEERPFPFSGFDFVATLATLDTVNDLPGALIHIRNALAQNGLMIASFIGAGTLPELRSRKQAAQPQGCIIRTRVLLRKSAMVQGFLGFSPTEGWAGPK